MTTLMTSQLYLTAIIVVHLYLCYCPNYRDDDTVSLSSILLLPHLLLLVVCVVYAVSLALALLMSLNKSY